MATVYRTDAPTTGYWYAGDRAINSAYVTGAPVSWECVVSGEPGTWVAVRSAVASTGGAVNGATVSASDKVQAVNQTVLTLAATPVPVTDLLAYAGLKVYDFPEGRILVLGCTANIQWAVTSTRASTINNNAALDWSLGTATASNVTLSGTMVDLLPKVDTTLSAANADYNTPATASLAASAQFDGTSAAKDMYLNVSFPTTTDIDADGTMAANGTITITWVNLGDY